MKKRALSILLSLCVMGSMLAVPAAAEEEPVQLELYTVSFGVNNDSLAKVNQAVNDYIRPLINAEVNLNILSYSSYLNQVNLMMSGSDPVDLLMSTGGLTKTLANQGALLPLDELLAADGAGIVEVLGEDILQAGSYNGQVYAVPSNCEKARAIEYFYSKEMNEKYDLGLENAKSMDDLEACFQKLKEVAPEITAITGANAADNAAINQYNWEQVCNNYAVILYDEGDGLKVSNLYESETYRNLIDRMHKWYEEGYIYEEIDTTKVSGVDLFRTGKYLGYMANGKPNALFEQSQAMGTEMGSVQIVPPYMSSATVQAATWAIPHNSKNPEKAMEFLNLMYTDPTLVNLLCYGIEGENYQIIDEENGIIDYPEGVTTETKTYDNSMSWVWGNMLIGYCWNGNAPAQDVIDFNESAVRSKALGFTFDSSAVQNEVTACSNVVARYAVGLEWGKLDPETVLPEFQEELHDAGIDTIIEEAQKQLDAWAQENGVK